MVCDMELRTSPKPAGFVRSLHLDDPWLVGLMVLAFLLRLIFWIYTKRVWEDALITVLHSENFYNGLGLTHFRIDDPRPLHGFTSPISVLVPLIADRFHVGWGLSFQKLLSLFGGPVAVWFSYRLMREYVAPMSKAAAVLGAGYIALEHHQILWGMAGMETQLATVISLASIFYLLRGNIVAIGVTSGLCLLVRPDFVLWTAIAATVVAYTSYRKKTARPLLTFAGIVAVIYGPWLIFTTIYYGSPVPNTIVAKTLGYVGYWEVATSAAMFIRGTAVAFGRIFLPLEPVFGGNGTGFIPLIQGYWMAQLCLVVIVVGFIFELVRRRWQLWPVYVFAAACACFLAFRAPVIFGWYAVPLCALLALLLAKGVSDIAGMLPANSRSAMAWVVTVAYLASFAVVLPTTFRAERNIQELVENKVRKQIGLYLANTPVDTTIAGEPLGYVGYYSRRTYYDYPGLCSRKVTRWLQAHKYPRVWKTLQVYSYVRPDYLVLRKKEYGDFSSEPDGNFLKSDYHLEREFAVTPEDGKKLLHPEKNIDLDFLLLARNKRVTNTESQ